MSVHSYEIDQPTAETVRLAAEQLLAHTALTHNIASPYGVNVQAQELRMLDPTIPTLTNQALRGITVSTRRTGIRAIIRHSLRPPVAPAVRFSPGFTISERQLHGHSKIDPLAFFTVRSVSYDGSLQIDDQKYSFGPQQKAIIATTQWAAEAQAQPDQRAIFVLSPDAQEPLVAYHGIEHYGYPSVVPERSALTNMLAVIMQAQTMAVA